MTDLIKIPRTFYDDHRDRDLESPKILKETKTHYWIKADDPDIAELKSDAHYYYTLWREGAFDKYLFGLCMSAGATLKALEA